jgi:two-component SAPR family response regulator
LFYFLLSHPSWVHRNEIIAALWPDYSEARGSSVLRTTAYRLRKAMYDECLIRENSYFRLDPGGQFWLDAAEFERLVQEVQTTDLSEDERRERLKQAVQLYRGDFLKGVDGEWCENTRVKLESYYLTAVMSLADEQFARGQYADAARAAQRALEADPYHEDALALLLESLVYSGERIAALEQFRLFADRLKGDLDEEPSPRLQRIARRIRSLQSPTSEAAPARGR